MSNTAHINLINLQVVAEEQMALDKAAGTYNANKASDSKYYLWQSDLQTIPIGMDGNPEQFAAKLREALPGVTTLRLPFNEFSFVDGELHEQYARFLHAAAAEGFELLLTYAGGDAQRYGADGASGDDIHAALEGRIFDGMAIGWGQMLDWLDAAPDVREAVWGCEIANEPATYARGRQADGMNTTRFQELYAEHMVALSDMISAETDAKILVGGWNYSGRFSELDEGDVNGLTALEAIREGVSDALVWSAHLYPGWVGGDATTPGDLGAALTDHYAVLGSDDILVTETNASGGLVDNPDELGGPVDIFTQAYEWFAEAGIGLGWFPGAETGASNFVVVDPNGSLRFLHQGSLAHGMNAFSLDEAPAEHAGGEAISTTLVAGRVRNEAWQPEGRTFDAVEGIAYGFGYGGNDTITGSNTANDLIYGGTGNDAAVGGGGDDHLFGQYGNDTLSGGAGDDHLFGGDGDDRLTGNAGNDMMTGGAGADLFVAGTGTLGVTDFDYAEGDRLLLGGAVLTLEAMLSQGTVTGGTDLRIGDTLFHGFTARHDMAGGGPSDIAEKITGTDEADTIRADGGDDTVHGNDGNDLIEGGAGDDWIYGGRGADTLDGGEGNDRVVGQKGANTILGGAGNDRLESGQHSSSLDGGAGADTLVFSLVKGAEHTGSGGGGVDTFAIVTSGAERAGQVVLTDVDLSIEEISVDGVDLGTVMASRPVGGSMTDLAEGVLLHVTDTNTLLLRGTDVQDAAQALGLDAPAAPDAEDDLAGGYTDSAGRTASQGSDTLGGSTGDDLVCAGGGDDYVWGLSGSDTLMGGSGADTLIAHAGNDVLDGRSGNDELLGMKGNNTLLGGGGDDRIYTGYHTDTVDAGAGADVLTADLSRGADHVLTGGIGADVFIFKGAAGRSSVVTVTDYDGAEDTIDLSATSPLSVNDAEGGALVDLGGGDAILFEGIVAADLDWLIA